VRYKTKVKQAQYVGKVKIEPNGGELTELQAKSIMADPWGKELIKKGVLIIEGVKPPDAEAAKPAETGNTEGAKIDKKK
jgi:hypothetical protein